MQKGRNKVAFFKSFIFANLIKWAKSSISNLFQREIMLKKIQLYTIKMQKLAGKKKPPPSTSLEPMRKEKASSSSDIVEFHGSELIRSNSSESNRLRFFDLFGLFLFED